MGKRMFIYPLFLCKRREEMRQSSLAASGLVIAIVAVLLLVGLTLNASASSKTGAGTTSVLGASGTDPPSGLADPPTTASIGLMAGTVMFVVGGVGGLWLVVSRGVGYLGGRRAASAVPSLRQIAVPAAFPVGLPLASGQSDALHIESPPPGPEVVQVTQPAAAEKAPEDAPVEKTKRARRSSPLEELIAEGSAGSAGSITSKKSTAHKSARNHSKVHARAGIAHVATHHR